MATYTAPYTVTIMRVPHVVANFANETAFNTIFAVGIVLTAIVIALSFAIKNYGVSKVLQQKQIRRVRGVLSPKTIFIFRN
jgi:hypothetical protein